MKKIAAVIPSYSYGEPDLAMSAVSRLKAIGGIDEIIVVHDYCPCQAPDLTHIEGVKNLVMLKRSGFGRCVNKAIASTDADYILLVNSDLLVTTPELRPLILDSFSADPYLGVMGALTTFPDGKIQHAGAWVNWMNTAHYGTGQPVSPLYQNKFYCPWVTFALVAIRRECWQDVGYLDESFFMYFEDSSFCFNAWEKGWKVIYEPALTGVHLEAGTVKRLNLADRELLQVMRVRAQGIFNQQGYKRDWNQIHAAVWAENTKLHADINDGKVLIIERHGALGDVVMLSGILPSLRQNYPDWHIGIRTNCPEVFRGNPLVYDAKPNLTAAQAKVVTLNLAYESRPGKSIEQAFCDELEKWGFEAYPGPLKLYSDELDWHALLARYREWLAAPYIVIHPAKSHWQNRTLPSLFWHQVVLELKKLGKTIVVVGTEGDQRIELSGLLDLRGRTTIHELHQLIDHACLYIGSDSGPLHVARCTSTPKIGIFTILNPATRMELDETNKAVVPPASSCRFCLMDMTDPVTFVECPKNKSYECTKTVSAADVIKAAKEVLSGK